MSGNILKIHDGTFHMLPINENSHKIANIVCTIDRVKYISGSQTCNSVSSQFSNS